MTRTTALLGAGLLLLATFAGCLIPTGPEGGSAYYTYMSIRPDKFLEAAPEGMVYQLFLMDIAFDTVGGQPIPTDDITFDPLVRFQWDPENFRSLDEDGNGIPLYDPGGIGMDMGKNLLGHNLIGLFLEPRNDPNPNDPDGPMVAFFLDLSALGIGAPQLETNLEAELSLYNRFGGIVPRDDLGSASVTLLAQSLKHGEVDACWRDETQGMGIWFATTRVRDLIIEDTVAFSLDPNAVEGPGTRYTRESIDQDTNDNPYNIWIFPDHPESSWSNFDNIFPNTSPGIIFLDGEEVRLGVSSGPPSTGVNALGSNPWYRNGELIGYMYFPNPDEAPNFSDTCFLRIDRPESTYCTTESLGNGEGGEGDTIKIRFAPISDTNLIIRRFTTTWADTLIAPSLKNLPPVNPSQTGWVFEAWVIFDSANNPEYPPLSLGRISGEFNQTEGPVGITQGALQRDSGDPYTNVDNFDPNFHFPGEDFLHDLPGNLPSPLDLMNFEGAEKIKIWITLEPEENDFAPDKPYAQFVAYATEIVRPDEALQAGIDSCATRHAPENSVNAPGTLTFPLIWRPMVVGQNGLTEGHGWPSMMIFLGSADEVETP